MHVCVCVCVSTWLNVVLETPSVVRTTTEVVSSTLAGVFLSLDTFSPHDSLTTVQDTVWVKMIEFRGGCGATHEYQVHM